MADFELDEELVRRLSHLLQETDLTEIEYESGGSRIRVARQVQHTYSGPQSAPAPQPAQQSAPSVPTPGQEATAEQVPAGAVTSPMVGTVYVAPEPNAAPFVQAGDQVREGQTLLIIEAMKVMNPLPAPRDGTVTQIMITDGQPVEFGEPLVVVE